MKTRLVVLLFAMVTAFGLRTFQAQAEVSFSAGIEISSPADFYDPLAASGAWVSIHQYGRCWHPARVEAGWRPYTVGHWEWTDVGWYWVSDEPWAWACYHYGSWVYDPNYSWVWIPGTEWAPAWVTWRESDDYIGWAPCGPGGIALSATWFVFTDVHHFHDRFRPSSLIVNNTTIINRTRVIGSVSRETRTIDGAPRRVAINQGPRVERIQTVTKTTFNPVPIREAVRQTPIPPAVRQRMEQRTREGGAYQEPTRERTGREQPRVNRQSPVNSQPSTRTTPVTPEPRRTFPEPTGREQPRVYPETQPRSTPVERPTQVVPERPQTVTPRFEQRPSTATGRREGEVPPNARRPVRETPPAAPHGPPPESERGRGHDKDKDNP